MRLCGEGSCLSGVDLLLWRGLQVGETAESIFPAKSFYVVRCLGENETLRRRKWESCYSKTCKVALMELTCCCGEVYKLDRPQSPFFPLKVFML